MRAVVQETYGDIDALTVREWPVPVPAADEVVVRVRAASMHPDVWHVVAGRPAVLRLMGSGLRRPSDQVPGTDVAGVVDSVGPEVTGLRVGDEVFGETVRGMQWRNGGAYAELVAVAEENLVARPRNLSFEQAACLPTAGLIVLANLAAEAVRPGDRVLVNGAGGGVGAIAVQVIKAARAHVTAVDTGAKLEMLLGLGADEVIDYTETDFTRTGERYRLVFDIPGNHPFTRVRQALSEDGTYVLIGHDNFGASTGRWLGSLPRMLGLMARARFTSQLPTPSLAVPPKQESMTRLQQLAESGQLTAVVDAVYGLGEVPEAIRHLQRGTERGRIVICP